MKKLLNKIPVYLMLVAMFMILSLFFVDLSPKPKWDGKNYSCPAGYSVYADEHEVMAGKDFVHCVK